jgi:hypothetical protein
VLLPGLFNKSPHTLHRPASCFAYVRRQSLSKRLADDVRCANAHSGVSERTLNGQVTKQQISSLDRTPATESKCWALDSAMVEDRIEGFAWHGVKHSYHARPCIQRGTPTVCTLIWVRLSGSLKTNPIRRQTSKCAAMVYMASSPRLR